jgi:hypothetical protein
MRPFIQNKIDAAVQAATAPLAKDVVVLKTVVDPMPEGPTVPEQIEAVKKELAGVVTPDGESMPADLAGLRSLIRTMLGQATMPRGNWSMSNNRSSKRLDVHDDRLDEVEPLAGAAYTYATEGGPDAIQAMLGMLETMLTQQADQFTAALQTQGQAFNQALAQQRTDLHAEILGTAGPLLETIKQIQALDLAEDAEDADLHNQLFALLREQGQQLTQLATTTTAFGNTQATIQANVTSLQTAASTQAADVVSLKNTATTLQATLTAVSGKADTTAASLASAQGTLTALGNTVAGHTTDITGLKATTASQGSDIGSLKTAATTQATDITGLKSTTATQTADITALKAATTGQGTDITSLKASATTQAADITGLKSTDSGLRTDIAALQAVPSVSFRDTTTSTPLALKMWHGTGTTDSTGKCTINLPTGLFAKVYDAIPSVVRAATNATQYTNAFIQTQSTTQVVVQVSESKSTQVLILNTMIEGLEPAPAGITVNIMVYGN